MKTKLSRRFQLKDSDSQRRRFLSGSPVSLGESQKTSTVTILRTGSFTHPAHGRFEVTKELFDGFLSNFEKRTYGQDIQFDLMHDNSSVNAVVAGTISKLFVDGNRLRATVDWTPEGVKAVVEKGLKYVSADYWDNYIDNEAGDEHGPLLAGAALVPRPHIKNMDPVQLMSSEGDEAINFIHPNFTKQLLEEAQKTMNEFLKKLRKVLAEAKLHKDTNAQFEATFEAQAKNLGEDKDALQKLLSQFEGLIATTVKQLSEAGKNTAEPVTLNISLNEAPTGDDAPLSAAQVKKLMDDERKAEAKKLADAKSSLEAKRKIFTDALDGAEGLSDETKKSLSETAETVITAHITDEQVKQFADSQIVLGNQMEASKKLSSMGFNPSGNIAQMHVGDQSNMQLQENVDKNLKLSNAYVNGNIKLSDDSGDSRLKRFSDQVLALFDADPFNRQRMLSENKVLTGDGTMNLDNPWFPKAFERTVIRELFHDFNILQLVQTLADASQQQITDIPYEVIDHTQFAGDGIVYEGEEIPYANAGFVNDHAYVLAMKQALKVSNEVMHFTMASQINWQAWGENISAITRIMRVRITRRLANEIQRANDSYEAVDVVGEDLTAQIDGTNTQILTAEFPVVRPHQEMNMQGQAVGLPDNPITLTLGGTVLEMYDGTNKQAAGTYYTLKNANLGYIGFVDEVGAAVAPAAAATTISYSRATNIIKFDLNPAAGVDYKVHLNDLLCKVGDQKAYMKSSRYVMPEYLLMDPTLNNEITKAKEFVEDNKRNGTDTTMVGDLEKIKGIPSFGTNAPGLDLGSERIHMGVRNTTTYKIAKAFTIGQPFEAVGANGQPTGQRIAYGEEYSAIKTPKPVQNRSTGIIVYNSTTR